MIKLRNRKNEPALEKDFLKMIKGALSNGNDKIIAIATDCNNNDFLFSNGDLFKVVHENGDMVTIERIGNESEKLEVLANFLEEISDYQRSSQEGSE